MGNLAYFTLEDDLIEDLDAANISVETEDSDYPETKLQNLPMADTARASDALPAIVRVRIDFGAVVNPRAWFWLNHNILSGDWLIHKTTDAWVSLGQRTVTYRNFDTKYYGRLGSSRYFEIEFPAACTYKNDFWEMGKFLCGIDVTEFSKGVSPGIERGLGFRNVHLETEFGVTWDYAKQENINYLGFSWDPEIKAPLLDELLAFIRITKGGAFPAIIIPDKESDELYYMKNEDRLNWREEIARSIIRNCYINFIEMSRGKITA